MKWIGVRYLGLPIILIATILVPVYAQEWTPAEKVELRSFWIDSLAKAPMDPSNLVEDDARAVTLGHRLFFDKRFSHRIR